MEITIPEMSLKQYFNLEEFIASEENRLGNTFGLDQSTAYRLIVTKIGRVEFLPHLDEQSYKDVTVVAKTDMITREGFNTLMDHLHFPQKYASEAEQNTRNKKEDTNEQ